MHNPSKPDKQRALAGIQVLDLTRLLPGAFCTQMLADYGADVLKIEHPIGGDYNRAFEPLCKEESGSFLLLNRNKRSLTLDLKSEEGKVVLRRLASTADVVVEGFRPGVMERLGLGYESLRETNPGLVYCAITGYGQDGPYAKVAGHDLNYLALAGGLHLFGTPATGPIVPGLSIADVGGGSLMAAFGILAALQARQADGQGQFVDISMTDGLVPWLAYHAADYLFAGVEPKGGERAFLGAAPCYNVFLCSDGRHMTLGAIEAHFWAAFCDLVGHPELKADQWPEGEACEHQFAVLRALFLTATAQEWFERLKAADIPATPANTIQEAFADPQLQHRQMLFHIDHPREGRIPQLGFPIKFSRTPGNVRLAPPMLGQHNEEALLGAGFTDQEIASLREQNVI